jgi:hypothetical protein
MSQKVARPPLRSLLLSLAGVIVVFAVIYAIDRITRDDVIAALATIVICGALIARSIWRGRYS